MTQSNKNAVQDVSRRAFLATAVVAAAAIVLLPGLKPEPRYVLYGDGVHDDTAALQAWCDGLPVHSPDGSLVGDHLRHESFRLTDTIHVPASRPRPASITYCTFHFQGVRALASFPSSEDRNSNG